MRIGGITINYQKLVVNKFNTYFTDITRNLLNNLGKTNNKHQDYLKNPSKHSFFLSEVTPDEIFQPIQKTDIKKTSDLYDIFEISPKLVNLSSDII